MTYEEIDIEVVGVTQKHIIVDLGDGAFQSFPADPENPVYAAWLEALEPAPKAK